MSKLSRLVGVLGLAGLLLLVGVAPQALADTPPGGGQGNNSHSSTVVNTCAYAGKYQAGPQVPQYGRYPVAGASKTHPAVVAKGIIAVWSNAACSRAQARIFLETQTPSGWQVQNQTTFEEMPPLGYTPLFISAPALQGVHVYRTVIEVGYTELGVYVNGRQIQQLRTTDKYYTSGAVQLRG